MSLAGQDQGGHAVVVDHCTDLDRNEVPCPPKVQAPATQEPFSEKASARRFQSQEPRVRAAADMSSAYVPLDSWVYAAFDRLVALGYAPTAFEGMRPWTRLECARLLREAGEEIDAEENRSEAVEFYRALLAEFAPEVARRDGARNREAKIESAYVRTTGIAGPALNQSYYFGQSIVNDFGRPYQEGFNAVTGVSARASVGPVAIYLRGEFQHAPSAPGLPASALAAINNPYWHEPGPPGNPSPEINRVRLLDAYAAYQFKNWQFSFGRQSLWWGPGAIGPLSYSDNAAPITMARISRVSPGKLPSILGWLGPVRTEFFCGRLQGQHFVYLGNGAVDGSWNAPLSNQPFLHGEKISFKPTPNFEFGVSRTGIFGGPDFPITFGRLMDVYFSAGNTFGAHDPGDRRSGFDFSYRVPYLRDWLILYNDSMTEDELSPIGYPRRSAMNPGIYLSRIPKLHKLDFRAEAAYTDLPGLRATGYYYYNDRYLDGYTNQGNIMGNWVGRQGVGLLFNSTYWFSPRKTISVEYRSQRVNKDFLQGGSLDGFTVKSDLMLHSGISLSSSMQYQRWDFPVLAKGTQSLLISTVQLTYWPKW
jgi:hypothetical protein